MVAARKLEPSTHDPVLAALRAAPLDEEPFTEDERAAFDEAVEDYRTGRVEMYGGEEVSAELHRLHGHAAE